MDGISKAARVGQMIIGVVYIVAGAVKVWEPVLFYWEAIPYAQLLGVVEWETASAVAKAALVLGPIEFVLGWALLLNWQPRLCLPVATVLMAAFTALTAKAWHIGASIDCGCFGALVERGARGSGDRRWRNAGSAAVCVVGNAPQCKRRAPWLVGPIGGERAARLSGR